jgi:hypothetical protein
MIEFKMATDQPTKPGTYLLRVDCSNDGKPDKYRNSRLCDVTKCGGSLMVYCLDIGVHKWIDECPPNWLWSTESITIEGDNRLN